MDNELDTELHKIDTEINQARTIVITLIVFLVLFYVIWFSYSGAKLSKLSGDWGTFGDYFGGLLNPVVASFAFYWITKSFRLQKEELYETRKSLIESAKAQDQQVTLAALTALINAIMIETQIHRGYIQSIQQQLALNKDSVFDLNGNKITHEQAIKHISDTNLRICEILTNKDIYKEKIIIILRQKNI
jgi:hypothetical protein